MDINDLMTLKALDKDNAMTPYEQYMVGYKQQKAHTSGVGIAGLVLGTVGTAAAIGAWVFGPTYANAKSNGLRDLANARYDATQNTLNQLTSLLAAERSERIAGDVTLTNTVNDSVSGSQQGTLTAQQAAELSAIANATNTVTAGLMTGQYSQNPIKVVRVSGQRECGCDSCGCNG